MARFNLLRDGFSTKSDKPLSNRVRFWRHWGVSGPNLLRDMGTTARNICLENILETGVSTDNDRFLRG